MTCPACGTKLRDGLAVCPECGEALPRASRETPEDERAEWEATLTVVMRILVHVLIWLFSLSILGFGLYKAYYWRQSSAMHRLYENGTVQMPELARVTLEDGRNGHAITFFGDDGDIIYIEELDERFMVVGGKAVVAVADAEWFGPSSGNVSTAEISLTPIQISEGGGKRLLPVVAFTVEMPVSPLTILRPTEKYVTTLSSTYEIELNVVYGSTVLVGGEDVTGMVDRRGNLSVNVAVYPHGDNPVSILVQTPNHLEVREDLVFYRQPMEINLELASTTEFTSERNAMIVRGAVDPTATLSVDSPHAADSIKVAENGEFEFIANFTRFGDNTVTVRASKPGFRDSVIEFNVYYLPTLNEYSRAAWKMDYQQVLYCWDIWDGRIFLCRGRIEAVLSEEPNVVVIDVSENNSGQYLVIENQSDLPIDEAGGRYSIYADISGQAEYQGRTVTRLIGRYVEKE
ncbi:MAG: hypothetical protein IKO07_01730 [Clostridia bacterium]|nr:hypothetical protein [Clostridia bacterium]